MTTRSNGVRSLITATALLLIVSTLPMLAQRFENLHGGTTCLEYGHAGLRVSIGGYISAGSTLTPSGCNTQDVYLVRLRDDGTLMWSTSYDLGGDDRCEDIQECSNGDFIITGSSDYLPVGAAARTREVFLLRVTNVGQVIWVAFYGTTTQEEEGFRVIQAKRAPGAPASGAAVGDFIVAGHRVNPGVAGSEDGYLLRVNGGSGNIVWAQLYGGADNDYLNSLDEANFGAAPSGDIIASGGTRSFNAAGQMNGFIVRVNGGSGAIGAAPQGAAAIGGSVFTRFNSIKEIKSGNDAGRLIVAGGMVPAQQTAMDIYVLKTAASPCTKIAERRYGDNSTSLDEGITIREILVAPNGGLINGHFYVCGESNMRAGGNGDMFAMEITPALAVSGPLNFKLYGLDSREKAWDIYPADSVFGFRTQGPYITGVALPAPLASGLLVPGDAGQMYIVKADLNGEDSCHTWIPQLTVGTPNLFDSCLTIDPRAAGSKLARQTDSVWRDWIDTLCNDSAMAVPPARFGGSSEIGQATSGVRHLDLSERGELSFYPNPVLRGDPVTIRYSMPTGRTMTLSVADLRGHVISSRVVTFAAGAGEIAVPTGELAAGEYLISLAGQDRNETRRVVVAPR